MKLKITKPILFIFAIFLLIMMIIISLLVVHQKAQTKFQSVSGKVIDAISRQPLSNIDIEIDSQSAKTNEKGEFYFEKVLKKSKIKVKRKALFKETLIPIAGRKYIEISIDNSLFNLFIYLEKYEQDRQYRKIYQIFHPDVKAIYSEEEYLADKNAWRDQKTNQGLKILKPEFKSEIKVLDNWKSNFTKKVYQNVTEAVFINNFQEIENDKIKQEEEKAYFVNENGNWWWVYQK